MKKEKLTSCKDLLKELNALQEVRPGLASPLQRRDSSKVLRTLDQIHSWWKNTAQETAAPSREERVTSLKLGVTKWKEQLEQEVNLLNEDWELLPDKKRWEKPLEQITSDEVNIWSHSAEILVICRDLYRVRIDAARVQGRISTLKQELIDASQIFPPPKFIADENVKELANKWYEFIEKEIQLLSDLSQQLESERKEKALPENFPIPFREIQKRCRADPFAAIQSVSTYSGAQFASILVATAALAGAAFSVPYYAHFEIKVWQFWVLQDYLDNGLVLVPLLFILILFLGLFLKKSFSDVIGHILDLDASRGSETTGRDRSPDENSIPQDCGTGVESTSHQINSDPASKKTEVLWWFSTALRLTGFIGAAIGVYLWREDSVPLSNVAFWAIAMICCLIMIIAVSVIQIGNLHQDQRPRIPFGWLGAPPAPNLLLIFTFCTFLAGSAMSGWSWATFKSDQQPGKQGDPQVAVFNNNSEIPNVLLLGLTSRTAFLMHIPQEDRSQNEPPDSASNPDPTAKTRKNPTISVDRAQILCLDRKSSCSLLRPPTDLPNYDGVVRESPTEISLNMVLHQTGPLDRQYALTKDRLELLFGCAGGEPVSEIKTAYFENNEFIPPCEHAFDTTGGRNCDQRWIAPTFSSGGNTPPRDYLVLGKSSSEAGVNHNLLLAEKRALKIMNDLQANNWPNLRATAIGELFFGGSRAQDPRNARQIWQDDPEARKVVVYSCEKLLS